MYDDTANPDRISCLFDAPGSVAKQRAPDTPAMPTTIHR